MRDAERFIAEVRGDDPELASYLRIEEREPAAGHRRIEAWTQAAAKSYPDRSRRFT